MIYRNYFAPEGEQIGQSAANQLDGLADVGAELSRAPGRPVSHLWSMQKGYGHPSPQLQAFLKV
jgi:hypothetical protein